MNVEDIYGGLQQLCKEVGSGFPEQRRNFKQSSVEIKGLNQLVSYVDIEAEKKMVSGLRDLIPAAGFITEEATAEQKRQEYTWIIDPLDGTTNFIHGIPVYSVSVGLMHHDNIVSGCIYDPSADELFHALKGKGAYLNQEKIEVSKTTEVSQSLMATGFPYYDFEQIEAYLNVLKKLMQQTHGLRRMGSAAIDLAWVAAGRFEGFFEFGLSPWDISAGVLLVEEAGGRVMDFSGGSDYLFGKTIIAGNHSISEELQQLISSEFTNK